MNNNPTGILRIAGARVVVAAEVVVVGVLHLAVEVAGGVAQVQREVGLLPVHGEQQVLIQVVGPQAHGAEVLMLGGGVPNSNQMAGLGSPSAVVCTCSHRRDILIVHARMVIFVIYALSKFPSIYENDCLLVKQLESVYETKYILYPTPLSFV